MEYAHIVCGDLRIQLRARRCPDFVDELARHDDNPTSWGAELVKLAMFGELEIHRSH
jgi:hypothetical protein